jgi:disulfide bond formation protein DsbB
MERQQYNSCLSPDLISHQNADLSNFHKTGRPSSDPANTRGIDMPPSGDNPALNDDKIDTIVAYIRSIQ